LSHFKQLSAAPRWSLVAAEELIRRLPEASSVTDPQKVDFP